MRAFAGSGRRTFCLAGIPGLSKERLDQLLTSEISSYALKRSTPHSLKSLLDPQTLCSRHMHEDIPCRLAHRVRQLQALPLGLSDDPHILAVIKTYTDAFKDLRQHPVPGRSLLSSSSSSSLFALS